MTKIFTFKLEDCYQDRNIKYYTVNCFAEGFNKELKVINRAGYLDFTENSFLELTSLEKTRLISKLTDFIRKNPENK
ncbi:hypothetical protein [Priestia sp. J2]|uniref:hypothetical protein n=1 Tax=Priestia sp. J2 TaxID=2886505 RepID=UPI001E35AC03|nr:hypothetical protein [Priestia sp. J2]